MDLLDVYFAFSSKSFNITKILFRAKFDSKNSKSQNDLIEVKHDLKRKTQLGSDYLIDLI